MRPTALLPLTLCATLASPGLALATPKRTAKIHVASSGRESDGSAKPPSNKAKRAGTPEDSKSKSSTRPVAARSPETAARQHRVARGETLGEIAVRYGTSVEGLVTKNGLKKSDRLREGQILALPDDVRPRRTSWQPYLKAPKRRGWLELSTPFARFAGQAVDSEGRLRSPAVRAVNDLLGAGGSHPALPERLIRLLVEVSDTFGGRPLRLVSGYRTNSYYQDSRHKLSSAVDFLIVGVPNPVVCDYLREFEDVGVGYYPNSSFVHLDVRDHSAYWVDYAGPGEPPRSSPDAPRTPKSPRPADRKLLAELDGLLEQTSGALSR